MKLLLYVLIVVLVAALFYWWQRGRTKSLPAGEGFDEQMAAAAQEAVAEAQAKFGVPLDLQADSVQQVETIVGKIYEASQQQPLEDAEISRLALLWGAYIGEVIRREKGGHWQRDSQIGEGALPLVLEDGSELFVTSWVHGRLTNGEEDNVWHKFVLSTGRVRRLDLGSLEESDDDSR